jgi:hypothetical protein
VARPHQRPGYRPADALFSFFPRSPFWGRRGSKHETGANRPPRHGHRQAVGGTLKQGHEGRRRSPGYSGAGVPIGMQDTDHVTQSRIPLCASPCNVSQGADLTGPISGDSAAIVKISKPGVPDRDADRTRTIGIAE